MAGSPMAGAPMAGSPMAGAPMAGSPMAGAPMGGAPAVGPTNGAPCAATDACPPIGWVEVPAGSFEMGTADNYASERPVHTVTLSAFDLSRTEVTVGQYRACVDAGVCTRPGPCSLNTPSWTDTPAGKEDLPVNCVTWGQARTFAKWVGGDLPTEAEWEYAARAGQPFLYAGSDTVDEVAWYRSNSMGTPIPVGVKLPNAFGLYDMSGNVREWVLDEWSDDYSAAPAEGNTPVGALPACGVQCENGSASRVNRGGAWGHVADNLRVAHRGRNGPTTTSDYLGVRVRWAR